MVSVPELKQSNDPPKSIFSQSFKLIMGGIDILIFKSFRCSDS